MKARIGVPKRLIGLVILGLLLIGAALLVVSGRYPIGGRLEGCESDSGNQNYFGIGTVPLGEDVWITNGSTRYLSDYVRTGGVPLIPIDIALLEPDVGLHIKEKYAYDLREPLFTSTFGQAGPLTPAQTRRLRPLKALEANHPWWAVARIEVEGTGNFETPGMLITYKAELRRLKCQHTTGVRFEVEADAS